MDAAWTAEALRALAERYAERYANPRSRELVLRHALRDAPDPGWAVATLRTWMIVRRGFAAWCRERGIDVPAPAGRLPVPGPSARARGMPDADHAAWLAQARREPEPWRTYWLVVSDLGLRESEALALRAGDVDWAPGQEAVRVRGKGGRERLVPIFPEMACWRALKRLTRGRPPGAWLFATQRTRGRPPRPSAARDRMARLCRRAGLVDAAGRPRYGVHSLRHTAARRWLAQGADVRTVQRLLGHAHLSTTEVYVEMDAAWIRADFGRAVRGR
ncbi:MAG: tyrosine-type recombinase/integrase [Actinomycetia bacterium]|nr:tyrosine-type recombinase/integrase [Actinomycetes bacterium]